MCICIYICTYKYIYYVCIYVYIHVYTYIYIYIILCQYIYLYIHTYIHRWRSLLILANAHVHIWKFKLWILNVPSLTDSETVLFHVFHLRSVTCQVRRVSNVSLYLFVCMLYSMPSVKRLVSGVSLDSDLFQVSYTLVSGVFDETPLSLDITLVSALSLDFFVCAP